MLKPNAVNLPSVRNSIYNGTSSTTLQVRAKIRVKLPGLTWSDQHIRRLTPSPPFSSTFHRIWNKGLHPSHTTFITSCALPCLAAKRMSARTRIFFFRFTARCTTPTAAFWGGRIVFGVSFALEEINLKKICAIYYYLSHPLKREDHSESFKRVQTRPTPITILIDVCFAVSFQLTLTPSIFQWQSVSIGLTGWKCSPSPFYWRTDSGDPNWLIAT